MLQLQSFLPTIARGPDGVRLLFNEKNGSSIFHDFGQDGNRQYEWTRNPSLAAAVDSTAQFKEGTASLSLSSAADYIQASGAANANTCPQTSEWFIGGWFRPVAVTSVALAGINSGTGTAAQRGWLFVTNASNVPFFLASNGTTSTLFQMQTGAILVNTWVYLAAERVNVSGTLKIFVSVNGVVGNAGGTAYSSTLNLPSTNVVIGISGPNAGCGGFCDMLQIRQAQIFGGANFTAPTSPIP